MAFIYNDLNLRNKRIIIVEDDIPSIKYYRTVLENSGASLKTFENGKDFVEYLSNPDENIDIVLIDFLIPFVNGIDCVRQMRKVNRVTPVLMITAYYSDQTRSEALIAGCNEYVLKPVYPEKLFCLLEKYLNPEHSYSVAKD
ncbi:MAG: response regulator [Bacteroidales bacterium]